MPQGLLMPGARRLGHGAERPRRRVRTHIEVSPVEAPSILGRTGLSVAPLPLGRFGDPALTPPGGRRRTGWEPSRVAGGPPGWHGQHVRQRADAVGSVCAR